MAKKLKNLAPQTAQIKATVPKHYKDWNEALDAYFQAIREQLEKEQRQKQQKTRDSGWEMGL